MSIVRLTYHSNTGVQIIVEFDLDASDVCAFERLPPLLSCMMVYTVGHTIYKAVYGM